MTGCICDHAGYCPLLKTMVDAEHLERCQRDPAYLHDRAKAAGVRKIPRAGNNPPPKPPKPKPCIPCGQYPMPIQPLKPVVTNALGRPALSLKNQFLGQSVVLVGGGPSLKSVDLSAVKRAGVTLAAMNNVATMVRPHLWFCVDLPRNFHETIWRDAAVMKFTFDKHLTNTRPVDSWNGEKWVSSGLIARDCPNVWGFDHKNGWDAATFLSDPQPTWGVNSAEQDPEHKHSRTSVMLPTLWLLYWLGFRSVYLLGCDFDASSRKYAFDETCRDTNDDLFGWLGRRFAEVRTHFDQHGFRVVNCTEGSKLEAFDRMPLNSAIHEILANWPDKIVTKGQYRG